MSVLLYRRRTVSRRFILPVLGALALLLIVALVISLFVKPREYRYARLRIGDERILEGKYPVRDVDVSAPLVASTRNDKRQGLIVAAHKPGMSEIEFERADGKRFHYFIHVLPDRPIRVRYLRPKKSRKRVAKRQPRPRPRLLQRPKPKPQRKRVELEKVRPKGQVVEIDKPLVQKKPKASKYVSEFDSSVKEETKARIRNRKRQQIPTPRRRRVLPRKASAAKQKRSAPRPKQASAPRPRPTPPTKQRKVPETGRPELPKLALAPPLPQPPPQPEPQEQAPEKRGFFRNESEAGPEKIEVTPRPEVISKAIGGAAPDYLKGVKEGDRTFLNTKAWKGASFFNRVKRAVAQHWNPGRVYRVRDPYGNIYGIKDRFTLVHVTLNSDGSLKKLRVTRPSGVDFLDEEATGALTAANPFPNPPKEVMDKDGMIRFSFGFHFEVSDRPLFRIHRYQ